MKHYLFLLVVTIMSFGITTAQSLSPTQHRIKTELFNYLKKELSSVSDYSYKDIIFNYNQHKFHIEISDIDYDPFMVVLSAGFVLSESYNPGIITHVIKEINQINGVKCIYDDDIIKFYCEQYLRESKSFTQVFHKMVSQIEYAKNKFEDLYEVAEKNNETSSHPLSTINLGNTHNSSEFLFPSCSPDGNDSKLFITKVKLEKNYTIVDFLSFNNGSASYCGINKDSYLLVDGKKYQLQKAEGISYIPDHTEYPNWQSKSDVSLPFTLYFSPIPENTKTFDFMESPITPIDSESWDGEGWILRGVKLDNSGWIDVNSETISSSMHKWQCLAMQIKDDQTIIKKRVTPIKAGTYVFSNNDEYIEDADTGRKYYLRNSSISFKSSPRTSYDTNPIEFAEVYPALPSNVKRINISSGTQYYIKDFKIRR